MTWRVYCLLTSWINSWIEWEKITFYSSSFPLSGRFCLQRQPYWTACLRRPGLLLLVFPPKKLPPYIKQLVLTCWYWIRGYMAWVCDVIIEYVQCGYDLKSTDNLMRHIVPYRNKIKINYTGLPILSVVKLSCYWCQATSKKQSNLPLIQVWDMTTFLTLAYKICHFGG